MKVEFGSCDVYADGAGQDQGGHQPAKSNEEVKPAKALQAEESWTQFLCSEGNPGQDHNHGPLDNYRAEVVTNARQSAAGAAYKQRDGEGPAECDEDCDECVDASEGCGQWSRPFDFGNHKFSSVWPGPRNRERNDESCRIRGGSGNKYASGAAEVLAFAQCVTPGL